MYFAEVIFRSSPVRPLFREDAWIDDAIRGVLHGWGMGGQIGHARYECVRGKRGELRLFVDMPERNSLSKRFALPRTREMLAALPEAGIEGPEVTILGRVERERAADRCREPSAYVLFTHAYTTACAVRCADCFAPVPLYRLPPIKASPAPPDEPQWVEDLLHNFVAYEDIVNWTRSFRRLESMWFDTKVGEKFAWSQLSRLGSELNKEGLEARKDLEERVGRKVYYFVWARKIDGDGNSSKLCPSCGGKWRRRGDVFTKFGRRCDKCRLVGM